MGDGLITIEALGEAVRAALEGEDAPTNGQIRAVPDVRTIRYYTTLGLLDRPAEMRGRTALYGPKHVLQLVAVKRLQAEGLSLAEIQERLTGLSEAKLRRLAGIEVFGEAVPGKRAPAIAGSAATPSPAPSPPVSAPTRREDFWRALPVETPAPADTFRAPVPQAVRLAPGVLLVVEHTRLLDDDERRRLTALAAPLIEALETLAAPRGEEEEGQ